MSHSSANDFDFFFGRWNVGHRRLADRLAGSDDWQTFDGTCTTFPVLGGNANVDDNILHLPEGTYRALTMRSFDVGTGTWAIWWLDGRHPHQLDVPVVGKFEDGVGRFFAEDSFRGKPVLVRFEWTRDRAGRPHWQQAFSPDAGRSWEVNWEMTFTPAD